MFNVVNGLEKTKEQRQQLTLSSFYDLKLSELISLKKDIDEVYGT